MTFKGKPVKVNLTGNAKEEFERLNHLVGEELARNISNSDNQILFRSIQQKIDFLKDNP
ncbi:MAG: hypothetical protein AABY09_05520 [Nanoarchaeota archaeon]